MSHLKLIFYVFLLSQFSTIGLAQTGPGTAGSLQEASDLEDPGTLLEQTGQRVLRFGVHVSGMGKMDPHTAAASQDRSFADMVFNGLLRYKPGNAPAIEPDLAIEMPRVRMERGKQIWTVKLRRGVMFQAGPVTPAYELTADDVVYSFTKAADKKRSAYAGAYEDIRIEKIDNYTVEFILSRAISSILFFPKIANYNGGFIVSKRAMEKMGQQAYEKHPVGTGPFMFVSYQPGVKLSLAAHDGYFRGKPWLDGVELYFIPDIEKRKTRFLSGRLDVIIGSGKRGFSEALLKNRHIKIDSHGPGEVTTVYFNTHIPPMDDIRVRKAIAHVLSRESFLTLYGKDVAGPVFSPVPNLFLPGGLTESSVEKLGLTYPENIQRAQDLLAEAGYPNGFTLELTGSEKRIYKAGYRLLKKMLARINITCNVTILPHSAMHKTIRSQPMPIVIYTAWRPNADVFLTRFFHSNSILITGSKPDTNFSHYSLIDSLIESARFEVSPVRQVSLWQQAQIKILSDMVAFPVMYSIMSTPRWDYVDYGHTLKNSMALYPQFTEKTRFVGKP